LYKVKKTFGGSRWKLMELTRVSRYLAYVTPLLSYSFFLLRFF